MTRMAYNKALSKLLDRKAVVYGKRQIFQDYCRIEVLEILNMSGQITDDQVQEHSALTSKYPQEMHSLFKEMSNLFFEAFAAFPYLDIMGDLFMQEGLRQKKSDQFFTHPNIGLFMSAVTVSNAILERGFAIIGDHSCGSGVNLLQVASYTLRNMKQNPAKVLLLDGLDIDPLCADMCYIQLAAHKLSGVVRTDDGLIPDNKRVLMTPAYKLAVDQAQREAPEMAVFLLNHLKLPRPSRSSYY